MLLLLNRFSHVWLCATPWMAALQAPPSLGFSRQEHWSGLPFPSPMHESEKWKWSRSVESDSRKMVRITLYATQQKRHRCIEQSFGLCGRGRGWDDLGEWYWNMYNIIYETNRQPRFDAQYWMLGAGALGWPRGMVREGDGRGEFRIGNTCTPVADSCWCMAKPIQYCKVISLQLK